MHPRDLRIADYTYELPTDRIALYPATERDGSRLLIPTPTGFEEDIYRNIADHIPSNALIVFNRTRVVEARLIFQKASGGRIEVFALEPGDEYPDVTTAMSSTGSVRWKCLVGGAAKWKHGLVPTLDFTSSEGKGTLSATIRERLHDSFLLELSWTPSSLSFAEVLHHAGRVPLPPYIKRELNDSDAERYQTVYARDEGSVAAPTAGLHFTPEVLASMERKGIRTTWLTLHVGAGTFRPVQADTMGDHGMHAEEIDVDLSTIKTLMEHEGPVYAVGTTSLRSLESLYWLGRKCISDPDTDLTSATLNQWDPYDMGMDGVPKREALYALYVRMNAQGIERLCTRTSLLVAPGYDFKVVDGLVTNFHQPGSTLLLLVAAFMGDRWREMYAEALKRGFRMLSFGDGCLLRRGRLRPAGNPA